MEKSSNEYKGKIVYWNGIYGFVEINAEAEAIFFYNGILKEKYKNEIQLLDEVSVILDVNKHGKHEGKVYIKKLKILSRGSLSNYKRAIGILKDWNGRFGYIESPSLDSLTFIFQTRLINTDRELQNDDVLVFNPVKKKSTKGNQLFAFFAYPIDKEKDITFLKEQYKDTKIQEFIAPKIDYLPIDTQIEIVSNYLNSIINSSDFYLKLVEKINWFKSQGHSLNISVLKNLCENKSKYLIQLWESKIIDEYDFDLMKQYFFYTTAENKRQIILRFSPADKEKILHDYFEYLKNNLKIQNINNTTKLLLRITYEHKDLQRPIYEDVKKHLMSVLEPQALIQLWQSNYIDNLPESFLVEHFDINDTDIIEELIKRNRELLRKIYENYFSNLSINDFEEQYPQIIKKLFVFEKYFKDHFREIIKIVDTKLTDNQRFILWIFGISIDFDAKQHLLNNHEQIDDFFKIKYFIHKSVNGESQENKGILQQIEISQNRLEKFAEKYDWNELVQPTQTIPKKENDCSFLSDVDFFINKYKIKYLDKGIIAKKIYDSLEKYQVQHLRLWLYDYVDINSHDYIGYRKSFQELTSEEQGKFRKKASEYDFKTHILIPKSLEVVPCCTILSETEVSKTYKALLENIFFRNGSFLLRKEDESYTKEKQEPKSSVGLNNILSLSELNKIEIQIEVAKESNEILREEGLNQLFSQIHTGEIEKALKSAEEHSNEQVGQNSNKNKAYVEDKKLRKSIIKFLNENQYKELEPKLVYEPKNFYRRLDEDSGIDNYELTRLFSIETEDSFGIIWENIDYTEDRATYIFKTTKENHNSQLEKIANAIVSYAQLRSTLSSAEKSSRLDNFRNNLGYIASIHKQRGENDSFENWYKKLIAALEQTIPIIPKLLEDITIKPQGEGFTIIINEEEIGSTTIDLGEKSPYIGQPPVVQPKNTKVKSILEALKTFNHSFLQDLDLD